MAKPPRRAAGRSKSAGARKATSARKPRRRAAGQRAKKATTAKGGGKGAASRRRPAPSKQVARPAVRKQSAAGSRATTTRAKTVKASISRAATGRAPAASARKTARPAALPAKKPSVRRERPEDLVPSPPSTLNVDRSASAARSGRRELAHQLHLHTETGPSFTGGDVDANWEVAYSSGDEAPGGNNPTPDQDVVEEIGRALGVEYADNEELRAADKVADRDRHRWELDPASADDYQERTRKK